ncbi:hypothetical protein NQ314_013130 [Rhamnusium bicolor]|uniref:Uncharacterized protein n=1 Tax=Rhamnusium bicolor TaxID=1586634 RepID=A0AAV8X7D2_9CUCU|nr:hypothetical protein NQ314_013130 [Rhamnusium bicolor]
MISNKQVLLLSVVIVAVRSIQPNCDPNNQFRYYCLFPVEYCTEFVCSVSKCGHFIINSKLVKIKETQLIPKCAFSNSEDLKYIYGANSEIQVVASGAFVNLPNLESIILSFNLIRELHQGTFKDVGLSLLDLSWNKIIYIPEGAFDGINGLKYLNLSRNELKTLPIQDMPPFLIDLNLSYNLIDRLALKSSRYPNLTQINFSHNILERVALSFETTVHKIDLAHNRLTKIDFFDVLDCEVLEIPSNYFSRVPEFLTYASIKRVSIHPNPWICAELQQLWIHLQNNFINEEPSIIRDQSPICSNTDHTRSSFTNVYHSERDCADDSHCPENMICRALKCWDPCKEDACDSTSICNVNNHRFSCSCPGTLKRDPKTIYSSCLDIECFSNEDCKGEKLCHSNNTCINISDINSNYGPSSSYGAPSDFAPAPAVYEYQEEPWWFYEIPKIAPSIRKSKQLM